MEKIAIEMSKYMNKINNNIFTEDEILECSHEYLYMLENNMIQDVINILNEEFENSNDQKAKELIAKVINL